MQFIFIYCSGIWWPCLIHASVLGGFFFLNFVVLWDFLHRHLQRAEDFFFLLCIPFISFLALLCFLKFLALSLIRAARPKICPFFLIVGGKLQSFANNCDATAGLFVDVLYQFDIISPSFWVVITMNIGFFQISCGCVSWYSHVIAGLADSTDWCLDVGPAWHSRNRYRLLWCRITSYRRVVCLNSWEMLIYLPCLVLFGPLFVRRQHWHPKMSRRAFFYRLLGHIV